MSGLNWGCFGKDSIRFRLTTKTLERGQGEGANAGDFPVRVATCDEAKSCGFEVFTYLASAHGVEALEGVEVVGWDRLPVLPYIETFSHDYGPSVFERFIFSKKVMYFENSNKSLWVQNPPNIGSSLYSDTAQL